MSKRTLPHAAPRATPRAAPPVIDLDIIEAGLRALGYSEVEALPEHRVFVHKITEGQSCVLLRAPTEILWNEHPRLAGAHPVSEKILRMLIDRGTVARAKSAVASPAVAAAAD